MTWARICWQHTWNENGCWVYELFEDVGSVNNSRRNVLTGTEFIFQNYSWKERLLKSREARTYVWQKLIPCWKGENHTKWLKNFWSGSLEYFQFVVVRACLIEEPQWRWKFCALGISTADLWEQGDSRSHWNTFILQRSSDHSSGSWRNRQQACINYSSPNWILMCGHTHMIKSFPICRRHISSKHGVPMQKGDVGF